MQHERSRPCPQNALGSDLCPPSIKVLVSSIFPPSTMFYTDGVYAVLWDVTSHKSVTANILGGPTVFIFREEENGSRRFLLKIINITTKVRGVIS